MQTGDRAGPLSYFIFVLSSLDKIRLFQVWNLYAPFRLSNSKILKEVLNKNSSLVIGFWILTGPRKQEFELYKKLS